MTPDEMLAAYDLQLRGERECVNYSNVTHLGPLVMTQIPRDGGTMGFLTYRSLEAVPEAELPELIEQAVAYFRDETDVASFEWKTRGHDWPSTLPELLTAAGFEPEDEESIMIGPVDGLVDAPTPEGVTIRRITDLADVRRALEVQAEVFGYAVGLPERAVELLAGQRDTVSLWIAEADEHVVCAGRISTVPGSDFAGIWGGATLPEYRKRGIYRALTAARARWAAERGVKLINSDSTDFSRPILERSGLTRVTTSTPYIWTR